MTASRALGAPALQTNRRSSGGRGGAAVVASALPPRSQRGASDRPLKQQTLRRSPEQFARLSPSGPRPSMIPNKPVLLAPIVNCDQPPAGATTGRAGGGGAAVGPPLLWSANVAFWRFDIATWTAVGGRPSHWLRAHARSA
jgi:hypothetical protein